MPKNVCPWWIGYFLISPIRKWLEIRDPEAFLRPYIEPGMTVFEPGPGMGFFTLPIAKLVGPSGRVIVVDIQSRMLNELRRRAAKAALNSRIETRLVSSASMGVEDLQGKVDFALAWAIVHEFPSAVDFFAEAAATLKPGGLLLFGEPSGHVDSRRFTLELEAARISGLLDDLPLPVRRNHAVVLRKRL